MFLQIRSIRHFLVGHSERRCQRWGLRCYDGEPTHLSTRSRSSTSIMDCICLLNCLLPFMPLIILRLLFH